LRSRGPTPRPEAAQVGAAKEECISYANILIEARDIPAFARDARHQIFADRAEVADIQPRSQVPGIAARAGHVVGEPNEITLRGIELVVAPIIGDLLADDR
jgi:hypothetical protein